MIPCTCEVCQVRPHCEGCVALCSVICACPSVRMLMGQHQGQQYPTPEKCLSQQKVNKRCYETPTLKRHPSLWCVPCLQSPEGQSALTRYYTMGEGFV